MTLLLKGLFVFLTLIVTNTALSSQASITCETYRDYILLQGRCATSLVGDYCRDAFVCYDRECIPISQRCDGVKHCKDGEDERDSLCPYYDCPEDKFRCKYGGCIAGGAKCNGTVECLDGSDEVSELCAPPPPSSAAHAPPAGCVVPSQPENGKYMSVTPNEDYTPGQILDDGKVLLYNCDSNYALETFQEKDFVLCFSKQWTKSFPVCISTCPPLTEPVLTKCEYGDREVNCSLPVLHGTRATTSCKNNFESKKSGAGLSVSVCKNGAWDHDVIECVPECGKPIADGQALAVNAFNAKKGAFPWHVAIYMMLNQKDPVDYICGGSLIKMNIVLSAAHCFANDDGGNVYDKKLYQVAAGKYYRLLDDSRDGMQQKRNVKQIKINEDYKGLLNNYRDDIAIVELEQPFTVSPVVQPVCMDWENVYEDEQLRPDSLGDVVGWGFTEEQGIPSEELQQLRIPYIEGNGCYKILPRSFYPYITTDKFCGGHTNGSSVCKGDSGGGLVFLHSTSGRYYIRGIVSSGPRKSEGCDSHKYALFTKISLFMRVISKIVAESRI